MLRIPGAWLLLLILCGIHQEAMASADTCCKYDGSHFIYKCQGCQLTKVPNDIPVNVLTLDLSYNNLTIVKDFAFAELRHLQILLLNNNQISYFARNALQGLNNLIELDFRRNCLCINDTDFHGVFKNTPHLKTLQLVNNECKETLSGYIDEAMDPLRELEKLSLPYVKEAILGPVYGKLTTLKYLMLMNSDDGGTVKCDTFKALENVSLEMLSVRNSGIKKICPTALQPLKELKYLNLACNADLFYANVLEAVNNLPASTLDTVIMDRVGGGTYSINATHDSLSPAWKNVRKLSMRFLNTMHINENQGSLWFKLPELRHVVVAANMIWDVDFDRGKMIELFNTTKVETWDQSYFGNGYNEEKFNRKYCYSDNIHKEPDLFFRKLPDDIFSPIAPQQNDFDPNVTFSEGQFFFRNMPLSVKYLFLDFFTFGIVDAFKFKYNPVNQLLMINVSNSNFFGRLKSIKNMTNLQIFDARNCGFDNLDRKPLQYPSLRKLLLSGNNLKRIGSNEISWSPFKKLAKLKHIDISDNEINFIKPSAFKYLPLLEEIKLQKNHLNSLNLDLTGCHRIKMIDVSQNMITSVTEIFMQSINNIAKEHQISLDLRDNSLDCDCPSLQFVKWFQQTRVQIINFDTITCQDGTHVYAVNTNGMTSKCFMAQTRLSLVLPTVVPTAFVVFMVALVYRKRWKIQFHYYLLKDLWRKRNTRSSSIMEDINCILQDEDAKDVFITCSDEDSD